MKDKKLGDITVSDLDTVFDEIDKAASTENSAFINPDGSFKGGFEGCQKYMQDVKGLPAENAQKLCAFVGRKAGKIKEAAASVKKADEKPAAATTADEKKEDLEKRQHHYPAVVDKMHYLYDAMKALEMKDYAKSTELLKQYIAEIGEVEPISNVSHPIFKTSKRDDGGIDYQLDLPIYKLDDEERIVMGVVYEPDIVDAQGDSASGPEIRKAAHRFMQESRMIGVMHKDSASGKIDIVESYTAPVSFRLGKQQISKGTWIMVLKVKDDEIWAGVKSEKYTGLSMSGRARNGG